MKPHVKATLRAAFTKWPHCVTTYVVLVGFAWLIIRNVILAP